MTTPVFLRTSALVTVPAAYSSGLILDLLPASHQSTIDAEFGRLVECVGLPSRVGTDFLFLSAAIYATDKKALRKRAPDRWTRNIDLVAPVAEPERWEAATPALTEALSFLTGDRWTLHWRQENNQLPGNRHEGHEVFDAVCLFSGGLDSLVGAIDLLEATKQGQILLLGHYDSTLTAPPQKQLYQSLAEYYGPDRVCLRQIRVRPAKAQTEQQYPLPGEREATTRSRSILFLGLGLAAASAIGPAIPLYLPENGYVGLNVPLINARLGSCSTRTTHPYFLKQVQIALQAIDLTNPIINPYERRTKGEVLAGCRNQSLLQQLAPQTVSCAHPEVGRYERTGYGNCGYCFPCLIRRAALHTVGLDDAAQYKRDVCTDEQLVSGRSMRGRDARAVFTALQAADTRPVDSLAPLLSGPLPDASALQDFRRVYKKGLSEVRAFFLAKSNAEVRRIAGL